MDAGDIIAIYAAVVATGGALFSGYSWRRSARPLVELREAHLTPTQGGALTCSCIAVNRSPYEIKLTRAHVRCRVTPPADAEIDRDVGEGARTIEESRVERNLSAGIRMFGVSFEVTRDLGAIVSLLLEIDLHADTPFPLAIPQGQGTTLTGTLPVGAQGSNDGGEAVFEVSTNDGLTFSRQVALAG